MSISTKFDPLEKKKKENFISKRKDFFRVENSEDDKSKVFVLNNIKSANASWKFVTTVVTNGQVETSQEWSMTSFIAGSDDVVGDLNDLASSRWRRFVVLSTWQQGLGLRTSKTNMENNSGRRTR